jgi:hypothetical protein
MTIYLMEIGNCFFVVDIENRLEFKNVEMKFMHAILEILNNLVYFYRSFIILI